MHITQIFLFHTLTVCLPVQSCHSLRAHTFTQDRHTDTDTHTQTHTHTHVLRTRQTHGHRHKHTHTHTHRHYMCECMRRIQLHEGQHMTDRSHVYRVRVYTASRVNGVC